MARNKSTKEGHLKNIITQKCGECGGKLEVTESIDGKTNFNVVCKKCNTTMLMKDFLKSI